MNFGLQISKQGINVKTATPPEKVFSNDFKTLPVFKKINLDQTGNIFDTKTFTIKHGCPFIPYVLPFYKTSAFPLTWKLIPSFGFGATFDGDQTTTEIRIDKENVVIVANLGNGTETISISLFIFNFPIALSL